MPQIRDTFFADPDANIAAADERWIAWWGELHAGPFNTDCMAETWNGYNCKNNAQPVPPTCTNRRVRRLAWLTEARCFQVR